MNQLKLSAVISEQRQEDETSLTVCDIFLEIDGNRLESFNTDPLDLLNLFKDPSWVRSKDDQYVYYLWTCSCGEPGCASISECKILRRTETIVEVLVPRPISYQVFGYERWKDEHTLNILKFSLVDVRKELLRFAAELRELNKQHEIFGYGCGYFKYDETEALIDLPEIIEQQLALNK